MPKATGNPVELIKRAAVEAVGAQKPVELRFGTVISTLPLQILMDQKLILEASQLILSRSVTDYELDMTVAHATEERAGGAGESAFELHNHEYKGRKKFLVHNGLKVNDQVFLVRVQGGKRFLVVDRIKPDVGIQGEWYDTENIR